jgi:hypothetical protein
MESGRLAAESLLRQLRGEPDPPAHEVAAVSRQGRRSLRTQDNRAGEGEAEDID